MPDQTEIPVSSFPDAQSINGGDKVTGLQNNSNTNFTFSSILSWLVNAVRAVFVPVSRTVNGKTLDTNITLTASDVGARPSNWTPSVTDIGAQPVITTSGILKGDGQGGVSAAVAGTDYQVPLTFDATPTASSTNPVQSSGVYTDVQTRVPNYGKGQNLLRNWYFVGGGTGRGVFPVNQRGQSSYIFSSGDYSIDGWKLYRGTMSVTANGLVWQWNGNSNYSPFHQEVDGYDRLIGQTVTISVLLGDGTLYKDTFVVPSTGTYTSNQYGQIRFYATASSKAIEIGKVLTTSTITLVAAKLELGSQQTLAHLEGSTWVLNEIPDYEEELIKCQTSIADSSDTYANKSLATEQQLATVESGNTASKAYSVKNFFCWNGLLYQVTAPISINEPFTPGTNCEQVMVGQVFGSTKMFYLSQESGTTSSLGNLNLTINPNVIIVGIRPSAQQAVAFYGRGSNGNYYVHLTNSSGSAITNTSVTLDVYYVNP